MHFLADVTVECDACDGRRFSDKVLGVQVARPDRSSTASSSPSTRRSTRFADERRSSSRACAPFAEVGLGYLHARPVDRDALGRRVAAPQARRAPRTRGAGADAVPARRADHRPARPRRRGAARARSHGCSTAGHTVVAIEHNLDFIRRADWLVDLGPEGGDAGGTAGRRRHARRDRPQPRLAHRPRARSPRPTTNAAASKPPQIANSKHPGNCCEEAAIARVLAHGRSRPASMKWRLGQAQTNPSRPAAIVVCDERRRLPSPINQTRATSCLNQVFALDGA